MRVDWLLLILVFILEKSIFGNICSLNVWKSLYCVFFWFNYQFITEIVKERERDECD